MLGKNRNAVKLTLAAANGQLMEAMLFTEGDRFLEELGGRKEMDIIYYPDINEYRGKRKVQVVVREYKLH